MICHVCLYFVHLIEAPSSSSKARGIRLAVAIIGLLCLQNSATISLFEDASLHHAVAAAYYVTYGIYMLMETGFTMRWDLGLVALLSLASKVCSSIQLFCHLLVRVLFSRLSPFLPLSPPAENKPPPSE